MDKAAINNTIESLLANTDNLKPLSNELETLKHQFAELKQQSHKSQLEDFLKSGHDELAFAYSADKEDVRHTNLLDTFSQRLKKQINQKQAAEEKRLNQKRTIINELKKIVKTDRRSLRKAYQKIDELQKQWVNTGSNHDEEASKLESEYKYNLELFWHNVKITRESIALDFKKNAEAKTNVIDKIKALLNDENIRHAEQKLGQYQKEWYRIGPILREKRADMQQGFDEAFAIINEKIKAFYEDRKDLMLENLTKKITLCDQINAICKVEVRTPKKLQELSEKAIALQKEWREIGYSEDNDRIWKIFKQACDDFFTKKKAFFTTLSSQRKENKKQKEALIEKADELKNNDDWGKTTQAFIQLQKEWKTIGPAHVADDRRLWKQFRAVCDEFFDKKSEHFSSLHHNYEKNLTAKEKLIKEIADVDWNETMPNKLEFLKDFENRWLAIGHVPYKKKDEIYRAWSKALNEVYGKLKVNKTQKNKLQYQSRIKASLSGIRANRVLKDEAYRLNKQIERTEAQLNQYKNSLSFFHKSNHPNPLQQEIEKKIALTEEKLHRLEDKVLWLRDAERNAEREVHEAKTKARNEEE